MSKQKIKSFVDLLSYRFPVYLLLMIHKLSQTQRKVVNLFHALLLFLSNLLIYGWLKEPKVPDICFPNAVESFLSDYFSYPYSKKCIQ